MARKKRVVIIESPEFAKGIRVILEDSGKYQVINCYEKFSDVCKNLINDLPEIILMGIELDEREEGLDAIKYIKGKLQYIDVLVISTVQNEDFLFDSISLGASGFIFKDWNIASQVLDYVDQLDSGGSPLSPQIARLLLKSLWINPFSPLSNRETEVMKLLLRGNTYRQIGKNLQISVETSKSHIRNIYRKLKVNSRSGAIERALSERMIASL